MVVPGLKNLGNTCFFNAILQALASLPSVHTYLEEMEKRARISGRDIGFTGAFRNCLEALAPRDTPHVVVPHAKLTNQLCNFRGNEQQDAQELLQLIFKLVGSEQRHCSVQNCGLLDLSVVDVPASRSISDLRLVQAVDQRSWNPLQGLQVNVLQCTTCHRFRPLQNQPFLDVSLSLVASRDKQVARLTEALQLYTGAEVIPDVECNYCSIMTELRDTRQEYDTVEQQTKLANDRDRVEIEIVQHERKDWMYTLERLATTSTTFDVEQLEHPMPRRRGIGLKRLKFSRSPEVFCFHFNRKVYGKSGGAVKLETHVEFPLELDMEDYCQYETSVGTRDGLVSRQRSRALLPSFTHASKQPCLLYDLAAVILHHGNDHCGHFTAYRRASASQWFFVSDCTVREAPIAEVLSSCAYMLFYERKYWTKPTMQRSETEDTTDDAERLSNSLL